MSFVIATLALSAGLLMSGCTNAPTSLAAAKKKSGATGISTSDPFAGSGDGSITSLVGISRVVKSKSDPTAVLDLVGDGTGSMGQFCQLNGASGGGTTAPTGGSQQQALCTCAYSYTRSDGLVEAFEVPVSYVESNLARCRYDGLPTDLALVKVRLHLTASDTFSNETTFRFSGTGVILDLANPASFVQAQRYQCRDIVTAKYVWGDVYDPLQSESGDISYPLNFYTTNIGGSLADYASSGNATFDCPGIPNDSSAGMDLTLFSVLSDGNSKQIFPPNGSVFDRSTFFLARQPTGAFSVGVKALHAPNVAVKEIGYGARPLVGPAGTEICPDSTVTIPKGFHWAKLWLFRATLNPRFVADSSLFKSLQAIACNPLPGDSDNPNDDCTGGANTFGSNKFDLADRIIFGTGQCINLNNSGPASNVCRNDTSLVTRRGPGCTTAIAGGVFVQRTGYELYGMGTDLWFPREASVLCSDPEFGDPLNLCRANKNVPFDAAPLMQGIDGGVSRFDFVFVVTPQTVLVSDMKNLTQAALPYVPYRFIPNSSCRSPDPDNPLSFGDCPASARAGYGIKLTEIADNADAPAGDDNRLPAFPVCVLQPDGG